MRSATKKSKRAKVGDVPVMGMRMAFVPKKKKPKKKLPKAKQARRVPIPKKKSHVFGMLWNFVAKVADSDAPIYIGIDPGSTGAIAFQCQQHYGVIDIPMTITKVAKSRRTTYKERKQTGFKSKKIIAEKREANYAAICEVFALFRPYQRRVRLILEKIPPTIGPGRKYAEIMLNRAYMMWPLFLYSQGYDVQQESPGVWKLAMKLKGKDKEASRRLALKLFPQASIQRKADHDRAEALLLSEYLRRQQP